MEKFVSKGTSILTLENRRGRIYIMEEDGIYIKKGTEENSICNQNIPADNPGTMGRTEIFKVLYDSD